MVEAATDGSVFTWRRAATNLEIAMQRAPSGSSSTRYILIANTTDAFQSGSATPHEMSNLDCAKDLEGELTLTPAFAIQTEVQESASFEQIKTAYKRKSLQCHPDRVPAGAANDARRRAATVEFQAVADAYFELSDPSRRKAYDELRKANQSRWTDSSDQSGNFWNYFGGGAQQQQDQYDEATEPEDFERPDPEHVFGNVFEELLRPEVNRILPIWTWGGAASGAVLGFVRPPSIPVSDLDSQLTSSVRWSRRSRPTYLERRSARSPGRDSVRSATPRARRSTRSSRTCRRRTRRGSSPNSRSRCLA